MKSTVVIFPGRPGGPMIWPRTSTSVLWIETDALEVDITFQRVPFGVERCMEADGISGASYFEFWNVHYAVNADVVERPLEFVLGP